MKKVTINWSIDGPTPSGFHVYGAFGGAAHMSYVGTFFDPQWIIHNRGDNEKFSVSVQAFYDGDDNVRRFGDMMTLNVDCANGHVERALMPDSTSVVVESE